MKTEYIQAEELDLAIPDMDSGIAELAVKTSLQNLPGIINVLLVGRGAFVRYNPGAINRDQICAAIRQTGHRAGVFQEAKDFGIPAADLTDNSRFAHPDLSAVKCDVCGVEVDEKGIALCRYNSNRFGGKILCRTCQEASILS